MASPHAVRIVNYVKPLVSRFVPRVESEPVSLEKSRGSDIIFIRPRRRTRSSAASAKNAFSRFKKFFRVFVRLQPFAVRRRRRLRYKVRLYYLVLAEETRHIDYKVLYYRHRGKRLDNNGLFQVQVFKKHRTGETVLSVYLHSVASANSVRARAPERKRAVLLPFYFVKNVKQPPVGTRVL